MSAAVALPPLEYVVRLGVEEDRPLICDSWRRGAREGLGRLGDFVPASVFARRQHEHIARCLATGTTLVAAHPDDASEVIGYLVHGGADGGALVVHWAWVRARPSFRGRGVGRALVEAALVAAKLPTVRPRIIFSQASREVPAGWLSARVRLEYDPWRAGRS
jgi:GNAT superfamily N-acetyltransferase